MLIGHYATALVAKERNYDTPLWLFVAAATLPDFVMSGLVLAGVERMTPDLAQTDSLFEQMVVDTPYSHDLIPIAIWAFAAALFVFAFARRIAPALWGGGLVLFHELCDLVSGFEHHLFGSDSQAFGLALYSSAPVAGLAIELFLALACVIWFTRRMQLPRWKKAGLFAATLLGAAAMLPNVISF
jgi:hypothetical protein